MSGKIESITIGGKTFPVMGGKRLFHVPNEVDLKFTKIPIPPIVNGVVIEVAAGDLKFLQERAGCTEFHATAILTKCDTCEAAYIWGFPWRPHPIERNLKAAGWTFDAAQKCGVCSE